MSELYVIDGKAADWKEALKLTSDELLKHHCVKEDFYESCVEREKEYPTGLTDFCPVALPHTSKGHVLRESICALRLASPVMFKSMEDTDHEIEVSIVLNMALLDDNEHVVIISHIINALKDSEFVNKMLTLSLDELKSLLQTVIFPDK